MGYLPINGEEMRALGWDRLDFVLVTGDAYVDHPSFANAVVSRVLEAAGYRVGILSQPDWHSPTDFKRFGRPRLGFLVSAGNLDTMVAHYTAAKKPRSDDYYSPGGRAGLRPNRATIVYTNLIRQAYANIPVIIGGVEASLRRFAHYDYWEDRVRASILKDSGADLLIYGMGERQLREVADALASGRRVNEICEVKGTCYMTDTPPEGAIILASHEETARDKRAFAHSFKIEYEQQDPFRGRVLVQQHGRSYLVQNPPADPLSQRELDGVYELPYMRSYHPCYEEAGGVPAVEEVRFSIISSRGCFGACSFCALVFHQGRIIQARSHESILREAKLITEMPDFKGYIHDVGGPTANFRIPSCDKQLSKGVCRDRQCLFPKPCPNMKVDHTDYLTLLKKLRELPKVKKVFIRSGLRFDYMMADRSDRFINELCLNHVSGQLKVAPEHVNAEVLRLMGKPEHEVFRRFQSKFARINERIGKKQYLVPYFISGHPGSDLTAAIELAEFLRDHHIHPQQVQDFYPTPGTLSTCMYYTGIDPRDGREVYIPRDKEEKAMQRALMQYTRPQNREIVAKALRRAGREDLIGTGPKCLIRPLQQGSRNQQRPVGKGKQYKPIAYTKNKKKR